MRIHSVAEETVAPPCTNYRSYQAYIVNNCSLCFPLTITMSADFVGSNRCLPAMIPGVRAVLVHSYALDVLRTYLSDDSLPLWSGPFVSLKLRRISERFTWGHSMVVSGCGTWLILLHLRQVNPLEQDMHLEFSWSIRTNHGYLGAFHILKWQGFSTWHLAYRNPC